MEEGEDGARVSEEMQREREKEAPLGIRGILTVVWGRYTNIEK